MSKDNPPLDNGFGFLKKRKDPNEIVLESLHKIFVGGIKALANEHLKGLSPEFQQNAIMYAETILKKGTPDHIERFKQLYEECKNL